MRRGAGAVPARPHVTQLQEPAPRPRNVGTLAAPAADPRGHTGGPGRHLILAAPPTSRVPVEVSHRGERSEERGGVWRAAEPVHRVPRPGHARHKPRGALGPTLPWPLPPSPPAKRAGRGPDERDVLGRKPRLPEVRTPRPVRLQAAAPRAWPQRPWPARPAGDRSGGARRPPRNRALHVAVTRPMSA